MDNPEKNGLNQEAETLNEVELNNEANAVKTQADEALLIDAASDAEKIVAEPKVPAKRGRKKKEPEVEEVPAVEEAAAPKRGRKKKEEPTDTEESVDSHKKSEIVDIEDNKDESLEKKPKKQASDKGKANDQKSDVDDVKTLLVTPEETAQMSLPQLLEKTAVTLEHDDFNLIKEAMILLRNRFEQLENDFEQIAVVSEEEEEEPTDLLSDAEQHRILCENFKNLLKKYSKLRKKHNEKQEAEKLRNYDLKKQILDELKELVESEETLQKSWEDFKRLQQQWKEIGHVPPAMNQDLWNSFNHLVDLFLDKVKINRELRDLDYRKNLETKTELCEKIEDLVLMESMDDAFKRLHELQTQWRETGPVPSENREEINSRFATAIDRLKEKRREQYESFRNQLEENLELKRALILKMKELNEQEITTAKAWAKKTGEVDELMNLWKNAGPVPRKHNETVWAEFKEEMQVFYTEKKNFFGKMKDELMENYNRKQLLCKQAESMQESSDWKKTTQELIALQNEWKTIGAVPHRYSDSIWKRFRQACDAFFNRKQEFFANIDQHEEENLKQKQEVIDQMLAFEFGENSKENLESIRNFQRRFYEIGRVPLKQKDKIQSTFQKAVDGLLDKLKISREEKRRFDMKQKYENMSSSVSGQQDIKKESFAISSKINGLESDIQLWENNISFFAKSKNADLLTKEFRDKIEKAKAELLILKEKQKMLKSMM